MARGLNRIPSERQPENCELLQAINLSRSEEYRGYKAVFDESVRHVLAQQEKDES